MFMFNFLLFQNGKASMILDIRKVLVGVTKQDTQNVLSRQDDEPKEGIRKEGHFCPCLIVCLYKIPAHGLSSYPPANVITHIVLNDEWGPQATPATRNRGLKMFFLWLRSGTPSSMMRPMTTIFASSLP